VAGGRIVPHPVERPAEVDGRWPGRAENSIRGVEVLAQLGGERETVRGGDPDRGRAADDHRPDRVRDLGRASTANLGDLERKPALVEQDDGTVLEPENPLRLEHGRRGGYVPSFQEARYVACSAVSTSISAPMVASLSRAISSSITVGTG
jgi:hypothetical protein